MPRVRQHSLDKSIIGRLRDISRPASECRNDRPEPAFRHSSNSGSSGCRARLIRGRLALCWTTEPQCDACIVHPNRKCSRPCCNLPRCRPVSAAALTPALVRWSMLRALHTSLAPMSPTSCRIRAWHGRGRRAALPRRGAAAHTRCRDRGRTDRGSHRRRRLAEASRPRRQSCGECLRLGVHADWPCADAGGSATRHRRRDRPHDPTAWASR